MRIIRVEVERASERDHYEVAFEISLAGVLAKGRLMVGMRPGRILTQQDAEDLVRANGARLVARAIASGQAALN